MPDRSSLLCRPLITSSHWHYATDDTSVILSPGRPSHLVGMQSLLQRTTYAPPKSCWPTATLRPRRHNPSLVSRRHTPPAAAADGASGSSSSLPSQQQQQYVAAYSALTLLHVALAAATTLAPSWSVSNLLGLELIPATALQLIAAGAYLWLLAACLACLKGAAEHDRLGSDTYQRLNLGVMYQSVVVIVLFLRHSSIVPLHVMCTTIGVFGATACVAAWCYAGTAGGFSLPRILKSFAANLLDLFKPKTLASGFYAAAAALTLLQFLWHYPTSATPLFTADHGPTALLLKQARGGGMVIAGTVWYVLKDAADRGRLAASTFRQLHLGMAVLAVLQLWALWQMHAVGVPLNYKLWRTLVGTGLLVLLVCDWQFFFAKKK